MDTLAYPFAPSTTTRCYLPKTQSMQLSIFLREYRKRLQNSHIAKLNEIPQPGIFILNKTKNRLVKWRFLYYFSSPTSSSIASSISSSFDSLSESVGLSTSSESEDSFSSSFSDSSFPFFLSPDKMFATSLV